MIYLKHTDSSTKQTPHKMKQDEKHHLILFFNGCTQTTVCTSFKEYNGYNKFINKTTQTAFIPRLKDGKPDHEGMMPTHAKSKCARASYF
jgi:hypothetical protein